MAETFLSNAGIVQASHRDPTARLHVNRNPTPCATPPQPSPDKPRNTAQRSASPVNITEGPKTTLRHNDIHRGNLLMTQFRDHRRGL